jgi:hypothetical protein
MDISHLSISELEVLNQQVVASLLELHTHNDRMALATLLPGMKVQFTSEGKTYTGVLLKKNRKTVLMAADNVKKQFIVPAGIARQVHAANAKITQAVKNGLKSPLTVQRL